MRIPAASRCTRFALSLFRHRSIRSFPRIHLRLRYTIAPCPVNASFPSGQRSACGPQQSPARAVYGAWHGYSGRAFVVTLGVLAFFLAIQLLFAAGNLGERLGRRDRPPAGRARRHRSLSCIPDLLCWEQIVLRGGVS